MAIKEKSRCLKANSGMRSHGKIGLKAIYDEKTEMQLT